MCKKRICSIPLFLLLFACSALAFSEEHPFEAGLVAGRSEEAGSVLIWNDSENLYVKFVASGSWLFGEAHAEASVSLEGIPQTRMGNPMPGRFSQGIEFDEPLQEHVFVFSLEEIGAGPGKQVFVAAHASVVSQGQVRETAWGQGLAFPGNSWAMYIEYGIPKLWRLPEGPVTALFLHPGTGSYFNTVLFDVPLELDVFNGSWVGWCVDQQYFVYAGQYYQVRLYSSYDPELGEKCPRCASENWDMVNYVLNHKADYPTYEAVQQAVWFFINNLEGQPYPAIPEAQQMVEDALLNGEGFVPLHGQVGAVILDPGEGAQLTVIEVDP